MLWGGHEATTKIPWRCHTRASAVAAAKSITPWGCYGDAMRMSWGCHGGALGGAMGEYHEETIAQHRLGQKSEFGFIRIRVGVRVM